jgi:hypothetical protein
LDVSAIGNDWPDGLPWNGGLGAGEGAPQSLGDGMADGMAIAESNLLFGWVDIDIHGEGAHFEKEKDYRKLAFHEGRVVTFAQRMVERGGFHWAPVEERELEGPVGAAHAEPADVARDPDVSVFLGFHFEQTGSDFRTGETLDSFQEMALGGEHEVGPVVVNQGEPDLWVSDCLQAHLLFQMTEFGRFRAEEFAPGGNVVEE